MEKKKSLKKKLIIIFSLILAFLLTTGILYVVNIYGDIIVTNYVSSDKILVHEVYKSPNIKVCYRKIFKCEPLVVKKEETVDTSHLGEYEVHYSYVVKKEKKDLLTKVIVYDDVPPEITLDSELSVCKNGKIVEGKYHAIDNYDGDITERVKLNIEVDKSYLEVTDSSNNSNTLEVNVLDYSSEPTIKLSGNAVVYMYLYGTYQESGYEAIDPCYGDLTNQVKVGGSVNTNQTGTYTLTYTVENEDGKTASATRKIVVQTRAAVANGSSCSKTGTIYLTFDDGPQSGSTETILNILKEEGVKATFFVTNNGPDYLIKREYDEGHAIALHTASHDYAKIYSSVDAYFRDLNSVSNRVKRITGYESKIIRFPGGSSNTVSRKYQRGIMTTLTNEVVSRGYRYHDWNVDSNDAGSCAYGSSSCVYNYVVNGLSKSRCNMVLMHDIKQYTANALRDIIQYGKNNGYTFDVITMDTPMVTQKVNN